LGLEVIASLDTLVVAGYVFACSLSIPRPGPEGLVTNQDLIALAVAQAIAVLNSDRQSPWHNWQAAARVLPAPAKPDPVQPPAQTPDAVDHDRAVDDR
jgi:hypothetical protein